MDTLEDKWGSRSLELGWTSIPTTLLFLQSQKKISPTSFCVLVNLLSHWWKKDEWPHPSLDSLAARIGVTDRTIQRSLVDLEKKKLIKRIPTQSYSKHRGRNIYDLSGLVLFLEQEGPSIAGVVKNKSYSR